MAVPRPPMVMPCVWMVLMEMLVGLPIGPVPSAMLGWAIKSFFVSPFVGVIEPLVKFSVFFVI